MTVKEAIDVIKNLRNEIGNSYDDHYCRQALDMAIMALKNVSPVLCKYSSFDSEGCWCSKHRRFVNCVGNKTKCPYKKE